MRLIRPLVYARRGRSPTATRAPAASTPVGCVCGDKDGVRREIRRFLSRHGRRHPGVPDSLAAALGNVNPRALFDAALQRTAPSPHAPDAAGD